MKLYSKNMSSMAELEREKRRLLKEKELLKEEELFSMNDIISGAGSLGLGMATSRLPIVSGIVTRLLPLAGRFSAPLAGIVNGWMAFKGTDAPEKPEDVPVHKKSRTKKVLMSVAREFIVSYLKWKAVELSYKGVTLIVKQQRKKKAMKEKSASM